MPIPGGGDPVGGGVRATDDRRGTLLLGAAEGTGEVQRVQGGDGGWIICGENEDTICESGRGYMDLEKLVRGRTAWPFWPREAHRAAEDDRQKGRRWGYIFCTGMSCTPW